MTFREKIEKKYPLNQVYFYLTEGCNLACRHCWIAPKFQNRKNAASALNFRLFCSVIKQAKPLGLTSIKLTGGEPLMHPQIEDILDLVRIQDLRLSIETNGVLCTPVIAQGIAACRNAFVSVSLDGTDAGTHEWVRGVGGCFEAALAGIRSIVSAGLRPQIIMTLMQHNKHQIEGMLRLAESLGAGSVKFNIVQPTARGAGMHEAHEILEIEELVRLGRWVDTSLAATTELKLYYDLPMAFQPMRKIFGENESGCQTCGIKRVIGVLSDGSYALCGIGTSVPDLIFGCVDKDRLELIWNENAVLDRIRKDLPDKLKGICGDCIMKDSCLGSCIAQNYFRNGDLYGPFWLCDEAYRHGLFPRSRLWVRSLMQGIKTMI